MTYDEGFAAGMRRAAEECAHEEQVRIWAHDIIEGLGFADVLKISSYDDNIAAHEVVEAGVYRVCQSLTDAIPPAAPWTPPEEAERPGCFTCLGWHPDGEWQTVMWIENLRVWWWVFTDNAIGQPTAFAPLPPAPELQP